MKRLAIAYTRFFLILGAACIPVNQAGHPEGAHGGLADSEPANCELASNGLLLKLHLNRRKDGL